MRWTSGLCLNTDGEWELTAAQDTFLYTTLDPSLDFWGQVKQINIFYVKVL